MKVFSLVVVVLYIFNFLGFSEIKGVCSVVEYYWRDYDGTIPLDAVQGGTDKFGYFTYIGQFAIGTASTFSSPDIVSATIVRGNRTAVAAYDNKVVYNNKHVKILCTSNIDKYRWTVTYLPNCEPVIGGIRDEIYYIGRANYMGHNVTGRFSVGNQLNAPWQGTAVGILTYEILMYCP